MWGGAWSWTALWDPLESTPPGSSVHGIFEARILEQVAISFSKGSSQPRDQLASLASPTLADGFFYHCVTWETLRKMNTQATGNSRRFTSSLGSVEDTCAGPLG